MQSPCSRDWWCSPRRGGRRQQYAAQKASEGYKLERASSACRHAEGGKITPHTLLAEPRSADNEETWATQSIKYPLDDHTTVSALATAATQSSATEVGGGKAAL